MIARLIGAVLWLAGFLAAPAWAVSMDKQGVEENPCPLRAGPHEMLFSGYSVSVAREEFCQDIRQVGRAVLTLDAVSRELRDMVMDIRIVRDVGTDAQPDRDLAAVTIAHLPARKYPSGTVTFPVDFDQTGPYLVLVTVTDEHGWVDTARFPLSVGEAGRKALIVYSLLGLAVLAVASVYIRAQRSKSLH
jgi:hypothetical protein